MGIVVGGEVALMGVAITLFAAISVLLFGVLLVVIVRLTFDRIGNHGTRAATGILLLVSCGVYWLVTLYHESRLRDEIERRACLENLREIHRETLQYVASHGKPPDRLRELAQRLDIKPNQLRCPATGEYQFVPTLEKSSDVVRAYDSAPHRFDFLWITTGGRHVLFADGEVRWLEETDFQRLFESD